MDNPGIPGERSSTVPPNIPNPGEKVPLERVQKFQALLKSPPGRRAPQAKTKTENPKKANNPEKENPEKMDYKENNNDKKDDSGMTKYHGRTIKTVKRFSWLPGKYKQTAAFEHMILVTTLKNIDFTVKTNSLKMVDNTSKGSRTG